MENKLLNALAARGCQIEQLLADTYMNREDFYVKTLERLLASTAFARLREGVAAGETNACFDAAHELKGLYATLGLTPAYELCSQIVELVRPLAGMEGVSELFAALQPVHEELVALIAST